jgi:hypothetical protein
MVHLLVFRTLFLHFFYPPRDKYRLEKTWEHLLSILLLSSLFSHTLPLWNRLRLSWFGAALSLEKSIIRPNLGTSK